MTEQEQQAALRAELLAGIQTALAGPSAPAVPTIPGVNSDASQADREAAHARILNKPAHHRTGEEAAYLQAVKDHSVLTTMSKPIDQVTVDERAELLRQIRDCEGRGWQ